MNITWNIPTEKDEHVGGSYQAHGEGGGREVSSSNETVETREQQARRALDTLRSMTELLALREQLDSRQRDQIDRLLLERDAQAAYIRYLESLVKALEESLSELNDDGGA